MASKREVQDAIKLLKVEAKRLGKLTWTDGTPFRHYLRDYCGLTRREADDWLFNAASAFALYGEGTPLCEGCGCALAGHGDYGGHVH